LRLCSHAMIAALTKRPFSLKTPLTEKTYNGRHER
jgi:hypothetical protein